MSSIEFNQLFWALMLAAVLLMVSSAAVIVIDPKIVITDEHPAGHHVLAPSAPTVQAPLGIKAWSKSSEPMSQRRKDMLKALVHDLNR